MNKRNYTLQDIYDFLLKFHNIRWEQFLVSEKGKPRKATNSDFQGNEFYKFIYTWKDKYHSMQLIKVQNEKFRLGIKDYDRNWQDFLAHRHNTESNLT